ncbi:alkanesulfonate monooxygenase SsuD/methylene tetrahydromethanopterin reductase-like flavin-dependent oxidoreductase (luciferase family) [Agromyces albus]|nr:alkanesulfonate monooxygenase SsuD/methylene tetrahydromethanopterin reductase-like flavin-dependent oxidoreductase (luciferase family) [Agromyces albus]
MPDYGHSLQFGTFITPTNQSPQTPVQLGVLSEQLGYDLVTFQDHPYQPGFLDTWTLLTWVAARTDRVHFSGNVLNLPLRAPAVLARSAASLDLLSGGRFDLGLGAGGFWDAIGAMGGHKLTPGQGVQALDEAIDIIRGIWAVDERTPLRVPGEFHHVDGAKRGPMPAHSIPIWWGRTSHGCFASSAGRPTAGCRHCRTCSRATSRRAMPRSTMPLVGPAATRARSGACSTSPARSAPAMAAS